MQKSESIAQLGAALVTAQSQIKPAKKQNENPFFHSTYADLESVWEACREALNKNGLGVIQTLDVNCLETTLVHVSGEFITGRQALNPKDDTPQGVGSAITYARRYGLAAMVGIIQTDDDGNAASGHKETVSAKGNGHAEQQVPAKSGNNPGFPFKPPSGKTDKAEIQVGDNDMACIKGNLTEVGPVKKAKNQKEYVQLRICETLVSVWDRKLFDTCKNYVTMDVKAFVTVQKNGANVYYNLTAIVPDAKTTDEVAKDQRTDITDEDIPF